MSNHEGIWTEYRPTYADHWSACKRMGDLVRCRDCEHFNDYHFKCHRSAHIIDAHGNLYWQSEGLMSVTDAGPDGFCSWGVRRDA